MSDPLIGTVLSGRYRVESLLGSGGMGAVYLVQHTQLKRRFALKLLHAETSKNAEVVARFEREAVAAANVDHPNIAFATDFGRTESGAFFLVLEYLEGERLRDALVDGPFEVRRALHITRQVAGALQRSHELGVIHRDLKPENIMLVSRGGDPDFVKVLDFGLAKVATEAPILGGDGPGKALTRRGSIFGTPKYMAPEQCFGGSVDGRADLYALGLILYEMLTGVSAVSGKDPLSIISKQIGTPTPPMKTVAPAVSVPASLEAVVMRLTEKEPAKRYADASAVLDALAEVASQEGIALRDAPSGATRSTPRSVPPVRGAQAAGQTVASAELLSVGGTVPDVKAAVGAALPGDSSAPPPSPALVVPSILDFAQAAPTGAAPAKAAAAPSAPPAETQPGGASASTSTGLQEGVKNRLPPALKQKPRWIILPLLGLLMLVVLRVASRPATSPTSPKSSAPKPAGVVKRASRDQIKQAAEAGLSAVLRLVEQYPQDARTHRLLAHTYMAQEDGVQALRALAKAAGLDDADVVNGEIVQAVMQAAKAADSLDAALGLLESQFGARGVDVLYALAFRPGTPRIRTQARQRLEQPHVRSKASAAAAVALELHAASMCEDKQRLLPRAAKEGDARALQQLKALQQTYNCGPLGVLDCWSCLRRGSELSDAIAAVEARQPSR